VKRLLLILLLPLWVQAQTVRFDTVKVKGFYMPTGAVEGYVLKVHANGQAYWGPATAASPTLAYRSGVSPVTGTAYVTFSSALSSSTYALYVDCYKTTNPYEKVGFEISARSTAGFLVTPLENCTIEYIASDTALVSGLTTYRSGIKNASTSGTVVSFDSTMGSTNYSLFVRAYTPGSESQAVGFSYVPSATGFTVIPLDTCKLEYVALGYAGDDTPVILRAGKDSAGTTTKTISFATAMPSTDYTLFVKTFKTTNPLDNVPFSFLSRTVNGFTVALLDTGYVQYTASLWGSGAP